MILFEKDWECYPTAIVDYTTTNQSFIRLSGIYKKMGVKNHLFPLSLINPSLQGVDPFSKDLTGEQIADIITECRWNPWYVVREIIRLPASGGSVPIRYKANRGNIALMWSYFNHVDFCLIQPRQTGKSVGGDVLNITLLMLMAVSTNIQLVTKDPGLRRKNIARLKAIRDLLPPYLNMTSKEDVDNVERISVIKRNNFYDAAIGQRTVDGADNLGRGISAQTVQWDEFPYIYNVHISMSVALAATIAARSNAKNAGGFYGNFFTTTAGRKDSASGLYAYNIVHDAYVWNESLYDCADIDELHEIVVTNSNSKTPFINGTFSHRQLGYTDEFLADVLALTRMTAELANRDLFNIWTSGSDESPLSINLNQVISNSKLDPFFIERNQYKHELRWYVSKDMIEHEMNDSWHILSLDSSNAVGADNNGLCVLNIRDLSVTAASSFAEANLLRYSEWIFELMCRYPKTIFIPENKSSGQAIIDYLLAKLPTVGIDPFKRIYSRIVDDPNMNERELNKLVIPLGQRTIDFYNKHKGKFGFMTTGNSRAHLYNKVFYQAAKSTGHVIKDSVLASEILGLVRVNGRIDHPKGGHDDLTIAWLLGHYLAAHSRNLSFYGIDRSECMTMVSDDGAIFTEAQLAKRGDQAKLRLQIEELKTTLKGNILPSERCRLEFKLKQLVTKSEADGGSAISLSAIMDEINESKSRVTSLRQAIKSANTRR